MVAATTDCVDDTILLRVQVEGEGVVCHEGTRSCFTKAIEIGVEPSQAARQEVRG